MLPLFLIVFIDLVGFGVMIPLLPYYGQRYGADPQTVTLLLGVYSMGQFIAAPVWGRLSDRYGRKPILLATLAGSVTCYLLLGFASSLVALFLIRFIAGLMAGNISTAMAYIADTTTPENRARGMGIVGAAFGLGFILGPVIGTLLAGPADDPHAFRLPAFASAALSAVALLLVAAILRESLPPWDPAKPRIRLGRLAAARTVLVQGNLGWLISTLFLLMIAMAIIETSFTIWINQRFGWGPRQVGYAFGYIGLVMAVVQGVLIGRLTRRFGEVTVLTAGAILLLAGFALLLVAPGIVLVAIGITLHATGYGLAQPSFNSLISKEAASGEVGAVMGVSQAAGSLSRVVGPMLAAIAFSEMALNGPFIAGGLITLLALGSIGHLHARGTWRKGTGSAS